MSKITILNWNCNGLYAHYEDFQLLLNTYNSNIVTLQESNLCNKNSSSLKNYNTYHNRALRAHGGVVLAIKNTIFHTEVQLNTQLQALGISCNFGSGQKISICCLYLPPNLHVTTSEIQAVIDQ